MRRSTKSAKLVPIPLKITDGIDLRTTPTAIAETASPIMQNWMYSKGSSIPSIRPAVTCETVTALSNPIDFLFHYTKDSSSAWKMGVSNNDIYYYNSSTKLWVDTTINVSQKPSMLTFNGLLLVADGSTNIQTWDGATPGTITPGSGIAPSVLTEINNRVVINDTQTTGLDAVYFSAIEDETGWTFTEVGGAVSLRAGYKDGSKVVGLIKNFKNELIVFKQGERSESIYRVQTLGAPYTSGVSQWAAEFVMGGQGASNAFCAESVDTAILFLGRYGFSALIADQMYSELNLQKIGDKVNSVLGATGNTNLEVRYLTTAGQVWIMRTGKKIYIYHPHNNSFTTYTMNDEQINSVTETTDGIYFAGESGHLYKLNESEYQDEFAPSTLTDLLGVIKTKSIDFGSGYGLVKFSELIFNPILASTNEVFYIDTTKNKQTSIDTNSGSGIYLDDFMEATLDFMAASEYDFMGTDGESWSQEIRKKWKGKRLQIQVNTTGRLSLSEILVQVSILGG